MKRIPAIVVMASLAAYGQKIEMQKADRTKITRLATTLNHLSVLEFNEVVREVAVGSSNFKVEWRENKVFIQPLEPDAATNLFIWTASGRQSYELVPAGSINEMHFAIDEDPGEPQTKQSAVAAPATSPEQPKVPAAMLMESTPVRMIGATRVRQRVAVIVDDVYQKDGRIYIRYTIENGGSRVYMPVTPAVFALQSSRCASSDSGCSERISLSSVIGRLPKTRNPKTDRSERRPIHSARFSHLQEQRFVRLFKRGTLENDDAIGALSGSQSATAQARVGDWELFRN